MSSTDNSVPKKEKKEKKEKETKKPEESAPQIDSHQQQFVNCKFFLRIDMASFRTEESIADETMTLGLVETTGMKYVPFSLAVGAEKDKDGNETGEISARCK